MDAWIERCFKAKLIILCKLRILYKALFMHVRIVLLQSGFEALHQAIRTESSIVCFLEEAGVTVRCLLWAFWMEESIVQRKQLASSLSEIWWEGSAAGSSAVNIGITNCQLVHTVPKRVFSGLLSIHSVFRKSSDENRLIVMEKSNLCSSQEQVFILRGNLDYILSRYNRDTSGIEYKF